MSNSQTDIALRMIEKAQKELGHNFQISDFKRLITSGRSLPDANTKEMQAIIIEMVEKK